ncbi:hypothetical protein P3G55_20070 [Leptospira sp. 96542]|nr:hypothetical protein [Leptospira sp. 96542]
MKKSEMKEVAKLGVGVLFGFLANRYIAKSEMVRRLHTENPALASLGASAGITLGVVKLSRNIKDKSFQLGLIGGSTARTAVEFFQIPAIHSKLPDPITAILMGKDSAFGEKSVTVGSDEIERFINIEAQKRVEALLPIAIQQIAEAQQSESVASQNAVSQDNANSHYYEETFGGDDEGSAWD